MYSIDSSLKSRCAGWLKTKSIKREEVPAVAEDLQRLKQQMNILDDERKEHVGPLNLKVKKINQQYKVESAPAVEWEAHLKGLLCELDTRLRGEAVAKVAGEVAAYREKGADQLADEVQREALEGQHLNVDGIEFRRRETYHTDVLELCRAVIEGRADPGLIELNKKAVRELDTLPPGVQRIRVTDVAVKGG